jgi:molybdopterin-containing oxidoreductase family iron-sulfur binding subunit
MNESRRRFLTRAGLTALGVGALPVFRSTASASGAGQTAIELGQKQWGMVIDIRKCQRPGVSEAAIEACHRTHNVPKIDEPTREVKWLWTETYRKVFADQVHPYTQEAVKEFPTLVLCNHCTHPSCVKVCPTKATWKRESDGIVMMDMHRCIGCRYCIAACPYGARSFNWQDPRPFIDEIYPKYPTRTKGVVEKCTFCADRLRKNQPPACVEACNRVPGGRDAIVFGDLGEAGSRVNRVLNRKFTIRRRPGLGTSPNVFYVI